MKAFFNKHTLNFKIPAGTSRGILNNKTSWFLHLQDSASGIIGIGECSIIENLSPDEVSLIGSKLESLCDIINNEDDDFSLALKSFPAIRFALETAFKDHSSGGQRIIFESPFLKGSGVPINGLVWMGEKSFMYNQIKSKIEEGYKCIKIKIAALSFEEELELLNHVRTQFSEKDIEIRLDANGGFNNEEALSRTLSLHHLNIHSIEQPIKPGHWEGMAKLCLESPIKIALDEELIGVYDLDDKKQLLQVIQPNYIVLKPSFLGGFQASQEWLELAEMNNIGWWITSALESNIGLNAIAQWASTLELKTHQGLGTGQLYTNNIPSPLYIDEGYLYSGNRQWDTELITKRNADN